MHFESKVTECEELVRKKNKDPRLIIMIANASRLLKMIINNISVVKLVIG